MLTKIHMTPTGKKRVEELRQRKNRAGECPADDRWKQVEHRSASELPSDPAKSGSWPLQDSRRLSGKTNPFLSEEALLLQLPRPTYAKN